ncbi:hypothetical protein [Mycobacterium sp.]|uniref:hypothetical protein n=1 Tax=Mycobacterium sp. TaxID=1785 RepID=UPI002C34783D|nr:hypothetical protein [Mycobacterium sp.]HTQ19067.1 hypothetical protein [Mycobacterium sp.]
MQAFKVVDAWSGTTPALEFLASPRGTLWVPRSSSTSRDQAVFVDQATDASLSSDPVLSEIDRFG